VENKDSFVINPEAMDNIYKAIATIDENLPELLTI
jgi:hypothetical protein